MLGFTNWFRASVLALFEDVDRPGFAQLWVNLLTALPTTDPLSGATDEVEWEGARVRVYGDGSTEPYWVIELEGDNGVVARNEGSVEWLEADTENFLDTNTVAGIGVYTASTGGNLVAVGKVMPVQIVNPGDQIVFADDKIRVWMKGRLA